MSQKQNGCLLEPSGLSLKNNQSLRVRVPVQAQTFLEFQQKICRGRQTVDPCRPPIQFPQLVARPEFRNRIPMHRGRRRRRRDRTLLRPPEKFVRSSRIRICARTLPESDRRKSSRFGRIRRQGFS